MFFPTRPAAMSSRLPPKPTAIIGAGFAGLSAARALVAAGQPVQVFDQGRDPGGRSATRRAERAQFDHGAQYLEAHDPRFQAQVETWRQQGVVAPWHGRFGVLRRGHWAIRSIDGPRYVGVPTMDAPARNLTLGLEVSYATRIVALRRLRGGWRLQDEQDRVLGPFARVVLALPAPRRCRC
ncbi:MAG TPA: FAD-dependent oxidoreductase [Candidatus Competibacteraceae bacterium]|nr:FAD-dependent oxidoreductase [Candidatus Competibacteraceae bacterium]